MKLKPRILDLTEEQIANLMPLYRQAAKAFAQGKPGIIIAQCTSDYKLKAAFANHSDSIALRRAIGTRTKKLS